MRDAKLPAYSLAWFYLNQAKFEAWEERAAIMQYDGGMTRKEAEEAALKLFEYEVRPDC